MKISTNSFGNYNPIRANQNANVNKVEIKKNEDSLKVTNEEKKFFTKMYPENEEQINGYHFYNKDGDKKGVSLGSLFDKRG
jgi:hypothetical protein